MRSPGGQAQNDGVVGKSVECIGHPRFGQLRLVVCDQAADQADQRFAIVGFQLECVLVSPDRTRMIVHVDEDTWPW